MQPGDLGWGSVGTQAHRCSWMDLLSPLSTSLCNPTHPLEKESMDCGSSVGFCLRIYLSENKEWKEQPKPLCYGGRAGMPEGRGTALRVALQNVTSVWSSMRELPT